MATNPAEIRAACLDDLTKLGTRTVQEQGRGSKYLCLHEIAVMNLGIEDKDELVQHLDPENNRIIIEMED